MSVIGLGGTDSNSKPDFNDHGNENGKFDPVLKDRPPIISPSEWLQISAGIQTSDLNNGRWNMRRYAPYYNDMADYNTSAKSYYDYLSKLNYLLDAYRASINQLLRREILTGETTTIKMGQDGNWETEDDITLSAIVKISQLTHDFVDHSKKKYTYHNAIWDDGQSDGTGGVFAKDFTDEINDLWDNVWDLWNNVKQLWNNVYNIYDILSGDWANAENDDNSGGAGGTYSVHMKNSFIRTDGDLGGQGIFVDTQDVYSGYNVRISVATRNGSIGCTSLNNISLGHGDHSNTGSYIFGLKFNSGRLANCDFSKLKNIQQFGNSIWNIKGKGHKWSVYVSAIPNVSGDDVVIACESYGDGNNDQFPDSDMNTCNINISFYVPKKQPPKHMIA